MTDTAAASASRSASDADTHGSAAVTERPSQRYDRSIVEGPLRSAVWNIAWPTMLTNIIGGLQGMVDHVLVGHLVGFTGNAAIGVAYQIFIIVIVFITSLFTGMSILVARFAGAGDEAKVNRTVYQAFLTAIGISVFVMAPVGWFLSPTLLLLVNAAPAVRAEAQPFLRIMFMFSSGMQGTGDTKSPLYISIVSQVLVPLGICFVVKQVTTLQPLHIWVAILIGHATRCILSVIRFNQGKWRTIAVDFVPRR